MDNETCDGQEILSRLDSLENTFAEEIERSDRFQHDCRGLRNIVYRADGQLIHVMTSDEHFQYGAGRIVELRTEDLV